MTLPAEIAAALARDTARPLITWYDDTTGERVELSVATFANWVAKTANLLVDTLDVQPRDRVAVALPRHWQTPVVQVATWLAGASLVALAPGDEIPRAGAAFVAEAGLDRVSAPRGVPLVALSLRPMGARLVAERSDVVDFAAEVGAHGDTFPPAAADAEPAAVVAGADVPTAEVRHAVTRTGLHAGQRALVRHDPWTRDGLVAGGLAPLLAGAGVVLCAGSADVPDDRLAAERVTATLG